MKLIIILLLIIFSSCQSPQFEEAERCTVSFQFEKCRCHKYDLNKTKRVGEAYDMPIEYCDDLVGFSFEEWAQNITPKAKEIKRYYQDTCK